MHRHQESGAPPGGRAQAPPPSHPWPHHPYHGHHAQRVVHPPPLPPPPPHGSHHHHHRPVHYPHAAYYPPQVQPTGAVGAPAAVQVAIAVSPSSGPSVQAPKPLQAKPAGGTDAPPAPSAAEVSPTPASVPSSPAGGDRAPEAKAPAMKPRQAAPSDDADECDDEVDLTTLVTTKPPRPYTEYTMFYQLEREFILHRVLAQSQSGGGADAPAVDGEAGGEALFEDDPLMPRKYRSLPLKADWYISGKSKKPTKRKHRKSHGKLSQVAGSFWPKLGSLTTDLSATARQARSASSSSPA